MTERPPDVAIVIPALDERENLDQLLPALQETLDSLGLTREIVVVDGGSTDGTGEAAARRGARVIVQRQPGYGGALRAGFAAVSAPYVITMDADLSHRPGFIEAFWPRRAEAEVFVASRYVTGGRAEMAATRRLLSRLLNRVYARVLALPICDVSSGFRMYRRDVLEGITIEARDFDVLEEILIKLYTAGCAIQEVPFHYMARGSGRSHVRLVRFGWAFARTLVRMRRLRRPLRGGEGGVVPPEPGSAPHTAVSFLGRLASPVRRPGQ